MRNSLKTGMTIGVLFFAVIVAYGLVKTAPEPPQVEPEEVAISVRVLEAEKNRVQLEVISQGSVEPHQQSELIPEASGRIKWVSPNLVAGGYFAKDDALLRIDDRDYRSTVARGQAALTRARAEEELARYELARMEELVKNKLTSQSSREVVLRNYRIAKATLQDAKLTLEQAKRDLWRTEVRAPYDGLVRNERVDIGQYITRGQSIASIYASDSIEVRLPVADRQLAYLDIPLGYRGEIVEDRRSLVLLSTDYGGKLYEWQGQLVRTEAEIDSRSRMVTAVVRVQAEDNPGQPELPIGLFVNAKIKGRWVENIVTLPRAALRNRNQVLIVDSDNRLTYRTVEIMRHENDNILISNGIDDGEVINISPIQAVIEGMQVKPMTVKGRG
ncbi:MAG: efflux RND transporter periplasmic adaptor subunit [Pseudomonadales bacterium]|nr:efflux RND transporter periplasmic adaptor subunit [Pseudomonadales bacterium]